MMCTIADIDSDMGWYYLSCKVCAKKVLSVPNDAADDGDDENPLMFSYYCAKCKCYNPKLLPRYYQKFVIVLYYMIAFYMELNFLNFFRYKLHLHVMDNTGNSKFLLFDNLALQLVHQPCIELAGPNVDEVLSSNIFCLVL